MKNSDVEIAGLTPKQKVLLDIMWSIETHEGVQSFISTLPKADQRDCRTLVELLFLAFTDKVDSVSDARDVLRRY